MQKGDFTKEEIDNLPIDITSNKLLEWLIDRRHVDLKWQSAALVVREKINNAIQDMPAVDEITQLLSGTYINYFHCQRILELLKETEAGSKNIFGYYSSTRMKDWQEIVRLYEKDNLYLAEAADMLIRNVSYEIPALKKQVSKCKQTQTECERKERDYVVNAAEMKEQFNTSCKKFGIKGQKVKSELLGLIKDLSSVYDDVMQKTQNLQQTCDFYEAFVEFSSGGDTVVPMVRYIQANGNTTVYQWKTGKVPTAVEEPKLEMGDDDDEVQEDQIDLGGFTEEVDYGIVLEDSGTNPTDGDNIDWGGTDDISFDIDVVSDVTMETSGEDGVVRGTDALTLLDHPPTRNDFINELLELQGFLSQRCNEMKGEADILSVNQFQTAPSILQLQNIDSVAAMLAQVNEVINNLTSGRMQHLFLIRSSPKYVDRLTESLKQKLEQAEKMLASQNAVAEKRKAVLAEQKQIEPKVGVLVSKTKELQKQIEADISKRYKNRPVNLMGAINLI